MLWWATVKGQALDLHHIPKSPTKETDTYDFQSKAQYMKRLLWKPFIDFHLSDARVNPEQWKTLAPL